MRWLIAPIVGAFLLSACASGLLGGFPLNKMRDSTVEVSSDGGHGSGVIVGTQYILTVDHVAQHSPSFIITYSDGTRAHASVVKEWPEMDTALLKLDLITTHTISQLACRKPVWGESIAAVGNALEVRTNIVSGVISSTDVLGYVTNDPMAKILVPVDATFNQGMSGGPVFDMKGKVLGLVDASLMFDSTMNAIGLPISLPANIGLMTPTDAFCSVVTASLK